MRNISLKMQRHHDLLFSGSNDIQLCNSDGDTLSRQQATVKPPRTTLYPFLFFSGMKRISRLPVRNRRLFTTGEVKPGGMSTDYYKLKESLLQTALGSLRNDIYTITSFSSTGIAS
jgi:hypothetical protein